MKHVNGHLRQPQELNPSVPDGINAITLRLLAKNPEDRYASDAELIEDLERVCAGLDPSGATTEMMTHACCAATTRIKRPASPQRAGRNKKRRRRCCATAARPPRAPAPRRTRLGRVLPSSGPAGRQCGAADRRPRPGRHEPGRAPERRSGTISRSRSQRASTARDPSTPYSARIPAPERRRRDRTISVDVVGTRVSDVPDVVGSGRAEAEQELKDAGFEVQVDEQESSFDDQEGSWARTPGGTRSSRWDQG